MARVRRRHEEEVVRPAGPPPPRVPPPWYRDVWPWLLALGLVVLAIIGGYVGYDALQDDEDDGPEVVTVTDTTGGTTTEETETVETETTTTDTTTTVEEPPEPVQVPDVVGGNQIEGGSTIEGAGLVGDSYSVASTEPLGTVVAQRPTGGTQAKEGDTVRMNVALGEGTRQTREVPDVTGPQGSDARATARRAGFTVRTLYRQPPSSEEEGEVLTQQPGPGTSAPELTQITIYVGRQ
jgi:beta-lactam-binding protein with PASTA domain